MSGTTIAQIIGLLLSPVITRLFDKHDFTTLEQYTMVLVLFGVFSTGKYELAIVQPKEKREALHLVRLCFKITFWVSVVSIALILLGRNYAADKFHNSELSVWLLLLPLNLFFLGISNSMTYWFNRIKKFSVSAFSKALFTAVNEPTKIGMGTLGWLSGGLVISNVVSRGASAGYLFVRFWKNNKIEFGQTTPQGVKEMSKKYSNYSRYTTFGSLFGRASAWAHIFLFSSLFGIGIIPFIALSRRVFMAPLAILSQAFSQVFFQHISEIENPKQLKRTYLKSFFQLFSLAVVGVFVVCVLPASTMGVIFGPEWTDVLPVLQILVFWFALNFVSSSLSFMLHRLQKQKIMFQLDVLHFILVVSSILSGYYLGYGELDTLKIFVGAKVVYFTFILLLTIHFLNTNIKSNIGKAGS